MEENRLHIDESLIISYLSGDLLSEEQRLMVEEWMEKEANRLKAFDVYRSWERSLLVSNKKPDVDLAFTKLEEKLFDQDQKTRIFPMPLKLAVAASLSLIAIVFGVWRFSFSEEKRELSAGPESKSFVLADSSQISLNKNSKLLYQKERFQVSSKREVWLEGEAFFEVEHQSSRPFIIHTDDAKVTVLGTKFLVKKEAGLPTHVLVTEGKVEVFYVSSEKKILLEAEEEVSFSTEVADPEVVPSDSNELYWKTGVMKFENQSLYQVFNTLSKEFDIFVKAENQEILACNLTATFKKQSLETILKVIQTTHSLDYSLQSDTLTVSGNGCF